MDQSNLRGNNLKGGESCLVHRAVDYLGALILISIKSVLISLNLQQITLIITTNKYLWEDNNPTVLRQLPMNKRGNVTYIKTSSSHNSSQHGCRPMPHTEKGTRFHPGCQSSHVIKYVVSSYLTFEIPQ